MATLDQLSAALVKADAAGNADDARALAAEIRKMRTAPPREASDSSTAENIVMGAARGVKDVIDTGAELLATGYDKLTGGDKPNLSSLVTGEKPGEGARVRAMNDAGKKSFEKDY